GDFVLISLDVDSLSKTCKVMGSAAQLIAPSTTAPVWGIIPLGQGFISTGSAQRSRRCPSLRQ
ncbi:hypothetical protein RA277_28645, partial [Pseudomonas syringae pv. tagetis]